MESEASMQRIPPKKWFSQHPTRPKRKKMLIAIQQVEDSFEPVLDNIVDKWKKCTDIKIKTISLGRSFLRHHIRYKDSYIRFYTLHKRFYTNTELFKMGIKESELCGICKIVEYMLLYSFNYGLRLMNG